MSSHHRSYRRATAPAAACALLLAAAPYAHGGANCPGYSICPEIHFRQIMAFNPDAIAITKMLDDAERRALSASNDSGLTLEKAKALLGKLLMFDQNLSVNFNQACASCHTKQAGYTGGISIVNRLSGTQAGSVRIRTANRKPQSAAYAAFAPILHYRASTDDFVGGNFWDARATGELTGDPTADQAEQPFTNPLEMALADHACAVRRVALEPYAIFFTKVWGSNVLGIGWPANTDTICARPNEGKANQQPVQLSAPDRARAETAYTDIALSIAAFERSREVSPFNSRFDAFQAGRAALTGKEQLGYELFVGKAKCNNCHIATGDKPKFTDFTSVNIGIPANTKNPFFTENEDNGRGLIANPAGPAYVDNGLGAMLAKSAKADWRAQAANFIGAFQVATLRNVAARPRAGFVRAYMHNGYFTDLKTIVHFYNTRDVLPRCGGSHTNPSVDCWPAPEQAANLDKTETGNLRLSTTEEEAIAAFLETLTDGYKEDEKN